MRNGKRSNWILIAAALALTGVCAAQAPPQGGAGRGAAQPQNGPRLAAPKAFPLPGIYPTTESVFLYSDDPGVEIHYTLDGSNPNATSTRYKSLTVNGVAVPSGSPVTVRLTGPRTVVTITVTSPDGSASTNYSIVVTGKQ